MRNVLFACDLDNTLLYSYKHRKAGDLCVEKIQGREQGYMTPRTTELLKAVQAVAEMVPVTSRSIEQYNRINWPAGCTPEYAVVANGAVLLRNGEIEEGWRRDSESVVAPYMDELRSLMAEFSDREKYLRCRIVDDAYLFVYCGSGVNPEDCVRAYQPRSDLNVVSSGKKVYFFPPEVNKGRALTRLKELMRPVFTVAAGDSAIDTPMLNEADLALIPSFFQEAAIRAPKIRARGDEDSFAEFVLESVRSSITVLRTE